MKNREYFLREDLDTYKPKFKMLCREKRIETEIIPKTVGKEINIPYICKVIEIKPIEK